MESLEADGIALVRKYRLFMPAPVKAYFLRLATAFNLLDLKREIEK
jgi:hypothetical protein